MARFVQSVTLATLLAACGGAERTPASAPPPAIDGNAVEAHVALLADDLYEGREAGKRGYALAAKYVATQFRAMGLEPGNDGSYFQTVPFTVAQVVPGSRSLQLASGQGARTLSADDDYASYATLAGETVDVSAPLVFLGYGVNIPSIERNDYEDVDLAGKIAVVVSGAPAELGSEVRAFYRSGRYHKSIELERRGAIGVIQLQHRQIASEAAAQRSSKAAKYWSLDAHDNPRYAFAGLQADVFLLEAGARKLFADSPISFEDMVASIDNENYVPMDLGMTATISHKLTRRLAESDNVLGLLPGSDPALRDEVVVLSAHLDGVGMGDEEGDNIYNGYYDNASGIGTMLEVARALSKSRPRRSILFLASTGEEKGLLGADYFASNPTVPIENIVANVNMDMVMFLWQVQDVVAFGAEHSTLIDTVRYAVTAAGVELSPDPFPERGYFTRSDQFPFVQQGIPATFFATGFKTGEAGVDPEALYNNFMQTHYHGPSDDASLRFDTDSAARVAEANYRITLAIANADRRPLWLADDFFGNMYGNELTRGD